jgi:hypothetical protein
MKKILTFALLALICTNLAGCPVSNDSNEIQAQQQESLQRQSNSEVGIPAIVNFREKRLLKDILELRDQNGLVTYTYIQSEMTGKLIFLGQTVGYGIPYATQYTNPSKIADQGANYGYAILPQADPNGLFSPGAAEGTWVMLKDPNSDKVQPIYIEPRIVVSPFPLPDALLQK